MELGRTAGFFSMASLVTANLIGVLFLGDGLSVRAYLGVTTAVVAIAVVSLGR